MASKCIHFVSPTEYFNLLVRHMCITYQVKKNIKIIDPRTTVIDEHNPIHMDNYERLRQNKILNNSSEKSNGKIDAKI